MNLKSPITYKIAKYIVYLSYLAVIYNAYKTFSLPTLENLIGSGIDLITILAELFTLYLVQRGISHDEKEKSKQIHLQKSNRTLNLRNQFDYGIMGGFFGGILAGLIYGFVYYNYAKYYPEVGYYRIIHITIYSAIVGSLMSAMIQIGINYFNYIAYQNKSLKILFNEITGGFVGGVIGSIPAGLIGAVYFWSLGGPAIGYDFKTIAFFIIGGLTGSTIMTFGILFYDFGWVYGRVLKVIMILAIVTGFIGVVSILILMLSNIPYYFETSTLSGDHVLRAFKGGTILGIVLGGGMGLQIGATIFFYRVWERIKHISTAPN